MFHKKWILLDSVYLLLYPNDKTTTFAKHIKVVHIAISLQVQVHVSSLTPRPTTQGHTATIMCSTTDDTAYTVVTQA